MDVESAKDGQTGELFIVQARPETVQSQKSRDRMESYHLHSIRCCPQDDRGDPRNGKDVKTIRRRLT
jgi:phosphoenolpyruvate synthase/pyruvate phosphate dikinase